MTLSIRPAEPDCLPDFAGVVEGIDLSRPVTPDQVAAITEGMDRFAVLVFRGQQIDDEQQLAFSRHFGPLEHATSHGIDREQQRGLAPKIADISNLGRDNEVLARDDRRRLFGLGNMLWHSDSSFKPTAGQVFAAARPHHPAEGRQHRVRRHARRLGRARRRDQGDVRGPRLHAQPDLFARHAGLCRMDRGGAGSQPAGAAAAGAAAPGQRPAVAVPVGACRRDHRLAGAGSAARSCAISTSTRRSAGSSMPTCGGLATW